MVILYGLENTFTDMNMELKTQINILTSSSKEGVYYFTWKDEIDLLRQIENISQAFQNSTETLTNSNLIVSLIKNKYSDRISIYGGMEFDINSLNDKLLQNSEVSDGVMNAINSILKGEDFQKGNYVISLTSDEMYGLFSLEEVRRLRLEQIL